MCGMDNHLNGSERSGRVCTFDPGRAADLILRSQTGGLASQEEADLRRHLAECPHCELDSKSVADLEIEMLLAADDNRRLQRFDPDREHARRCLFVTRQRVERFAKNVKRPEHISDEELEEHLDACPYCRRRAIIVFHEMQFPGHLPLVHQLTRQTVQDGLGTAWEAVRRALTEETRMSAVPAETWDFVLADGVTVSRSGQALTVEVAGNHSAEGRQVLVISQDHGEGADTLDANGVAQFEDLVPGNYYLWIEECEVPFLLDVVAGGVVGEADGTCANTPRAATPQERKAMTLSRFLVNHAADIRRRLTSTIPDRWRPVLSEDVLVVETYTDAFLDIDHYTPGSDSASRWMWSLVDRNVVEVIRMLEADKSDPIAQCDDPAARYVQLWTRIRQTSTSKDHEEAGPEPKRAIETALLYLPDKLGTVIRMWDLEGRSLDEVAKAMGREPTATCMLRVRAHRSLAMVVTAAA